MNWKSAIQLGCADASEQHEAWAELERLRAYARHNKLEQKRHSSGYKVGKEV